jgi:hypothetical protein
MILGEVFKRFIEKRPVCVLARAILERLHQPSHLNTLFEETAQKGYTRKLHFATLVRLMSDVVLGVKPSVYSAFRALEKKDRTVSLTAVYNKLDRVETGVSETLVADAAKQAAALIDELDTRLEPWLPGYRCRILDGNHLSATEHRLAPLRTTWAAPLPGTALVVLNQEHMLAERVFLTEDGHASERSLLTDVVEMVCAKDLWIADRNFCTIQFLLGIAKRLGYFVIRQHGTLKGRLLEEPRQIGRTATGVVWEQSIVITDPETGRTRKLRRITVKLDQPTRDGDWEIHLLSNVPKKKADAGVLAQLYQKRWTIETVFNEITMTLQCEIKTLGYPKAALFAFSLALVAFNAVSLLKASLRAVHGEETVQEQVSGYYLSLEISGTYDGMMVAIPDEDWEIFRTLSPKQMTATLKEIAKHVCLERYQKHTRGPKKPPPQKSTYRNGGHVATARLLKQNK